MKRHSTVLLAGFETLIVLAVGIAVPLAVSTVLWGFQFELAIGWDVFGRAAVDVWLLGHGVDLLLRLDPELVASLGLAEEHVVFPVTIAALGFALVTALMAVRTGRRIAETPHRFLGEGTALVVFGAISLLLAWLVDHPAARPSLWQALVLPTLVFGIGLVIGSTRERLRHPRSDHGSSIRDWIDDLPIPVHDAAAAALRAGAAAAAVVIAVAAVVLAVRLVLGYAEIIRLYESVQADVLGGSVITLAQLALLPNAIIWGASWLIGPGFAIGAGSSVTPVATVLGPLPTVPLLGALPTGDQGWGFIGLIAPIAAGFVGGALAASRLRQHAWFWRVGAGLGTGLVAGIVLGVLAWASGGAVGPGRLAVVGPDPLLVGAWAALQIGVAATLGVFAGAIGARPDRHGNADAADDRLPGDNVDQPHADQPAGDPFRAGAADASSIDRATAMFPGEPQNSGSDGRPLPIG